MKKRLILTSLSSAALLASGWGYLRWKDTKMLKEANTVRTKDEMKRFQQEYGFQDLGGNTAPILIRLVGLKGVFTQEETLVWKYDGKECVWTGGGLRACRQN
jgi:hypothetical protein